MLKENLPTPPPPITLPTAEGPRLFPVLAVFYDYSSDQGSVFISDDQYVELWDDPRISAVGLFVAEGQPVDAVVGAVSYTHLDVYKRQSWSRRPCGCSTGWAWPTLSLIHI